MDISARGSMRGAHSGTTRATSSILGTIMPNTDVVRTERRQRRIGAEVRLAGGKRGFPHNRRQSQVEVTRRNSERRWSDGGNGVDGGDDDDGARSGWTGLAVINQYILLTQWRNDVESPLERVHSISRFVFISSSSHGYFQVESPGSLERASRAWVRISMDECSISARIFFCARIS